MASTGKKTWIAPGSPIEDLRRARPSRSPYQRILILTEGNNEHAYFRGLVGEIRTPSVTLDDAHGVAMTLVERAVEYQKTNQLNMEEGEPRHYDQIWCVFDREHPKIGQAIDLSRRHGIEIAQSIPSFEVWQLLHLQELTASPIANVETLKKLIRNNYIPGYGKRVKICPYHYFHGKCHVAITRAKVLYHHHENHGGVPNPSTSVFRLAEEILKCGASTRLNGKF